MPNKPTIRAVNDGLITGGVSTQGLPCPNCNQTTVCVDIDAIKLPESIKPNRKLIAFYEVPTGVTEHLWLGIGCGCYAKFHRQIAHIQDRQKS